MQTLHRTDTYESLRFVALILIAIQVVVAALLMMPAAPQVSLAGLLGLIFFNFVALVAMFQMPVPPVLRLGIIGAMLILLLVVGAKSDPLGLRHIDQTVGESVDPADGASTGGAAADGAGSPVGARLTVVGTGTSPIETRIGGPGADGFIIAMRVVDEGQAATLIDWSIAREAAAKRCGRITVFARPAALLAHLQPIFTRSIERSVATGRPQCN